MTWHVDLSRAVIATLRALPRPEQRQVAARIAHLEENGIPPAIAAEGDYGARAVPAGDHLLWCVEDPDEGRIVIVTLRPEYAPADRAVGRWMRGSWTRWTTDLMGGGGMGSILSDLRFSLRSLRRAPAFSVTAVLTLALGIGASAAIFSVANGVLLSPLPYGEADEVVTIWSSWSNFPDRTWVSVQEYQYYVQESRTLEDAALYFQTSVNFTSVDDPEQVRAAGVTPNTFAVLGVEPVAGRVFSWEESRDSISPVMLGYGVWQRRFGGDPGIVDRDIELNGNMLPVMGVLPEGFALPIDYASPSVSEVFFPFFVDLETPVQMPNGGGNHGSYVVARLNDGETVATALADLEGLIDRLEAEGLFSEEFAFAPRVYSVKNDIVGTARSTLLVLLGAVGFVLLIACGNVANLLLSRSEVRMREVAVRTALGAGWRRIFRQLITESLVMAALGGALGLGMAYLGVEALLSIDPDAVPRSAAVTLDGTVVAFTVAISAITAVLFGAAPAMRVMGGRVGTTLHDGARGVGARARSNSTQGLLVARHKWRWP